MSTSVYHINKGINKPVEFKGLKAQYIWYLGGGLVALLILFAIMYISGVNVYLSLILIISAGTGLFIFIYRMSNKYGEHGIMKQMAKRQIPDYIKFRSVKIFSALIKIK
ncbi:MAG TPA: DUF4133 domain-containing protein [Panacibacter sp.]|nr:DUF4133 domain-containing protein [Panacibacter sp.]